MTLHLGIDPVPNQSGMLLLTVLVWVGLIAMLLLSLMTVVREQLVMVRWQQQDNHLQVTAEQGVRCAEYELNEQGLAWCDHEPDLSVSLISHANNDDGSLAVSIQSIASNDDHRVSLEVDEAYVGGHWQRINWSQEDHES